MLHLENFVSVRATARQLGIHEESLRRLLRIGSLNGQKIGGQWFIGKEQLALFAATYDAKTGRRKRLL
jgi:uncharacterized protein (UPF0548 family)